MWKAPASVLCGCLAALPLIGCAGDVTAPRQAAVAPPSLAEPASYYAAAPRVYAARPTAPAAVLVFLPGGDVLSRDPALWQAQGFDVVMPQPRDIYQLVADQQAAVARLVASAEALADAPIWLVGPSQAIEAAMPQLGGGVSGVVVTSVTSPIASCSESFSYYDPGTGAPPRVQVKRSGDCGAGVPGITGGEPSVLAPPPASQPNTPPLIETRSKRLPQAAPRPRIIEASAVGKNLPPAAKVHRLAELIKAAPPG